MTTLFPLLRFWRKRSGCDVWYLDTATTTNCLARFIKLYVCFISKYSYSRRMKRKSPCICYVSNVYRKRVLFLLFYSFGFNTIVSFPTSSLSRYFHYLYTTFYEKWFLCYVFSPTKRWQHDSITSRCRCRSLDLLDREIILLCRHCCFPRSVPKYLMDDRLAFPLHCTSWVLDHNIEPLIIVLNSLPSIIQQFFWYQFKFSH